MTEHILTAAEFDSDPKRAYRLAEEHGCVTVLDSKGRPSMSIVIPQNDLDPRDARIATLEAEVRRLTGERDEARAKICNACESEPYADSPCPCHHAPCRHDFNVKAKRVNDLEAQLATLSRCARNLCDDFEKYSLAVAKLLVDPNRQVFASEHAEHVALAAKVTESWKQARTSLAALDSGGGEGETNSPKNWESSK